jgi:hypothetical protein
MPDSIGGSKIITDTLSSSPLGSPESRAAARRMLSALDFPVLIRQFVCAVRDEHDEIIAVICDSKTAEVNGAEFCRSANESNEAFQNRCVAAVPVGQVGLVTMRGDNGPVYNQVLE